MRNLMLFFSLSMLLSITALQSCSDDDSTDLGCPDNFTLSQEVSDEAQAVSEATMVYANNPTTENCENLKEAYRNYINELREWEDCAVERGHRQEYEEALDNAERDLEDACQ